ncbi:hypothetical protein [Haloquadratum walsbyi]|uniref:hypothetical protein n=1 Tax=Haloquadratum walsbyi TaxID=293091 RepID=UPI0026EBA2F6|nr:hypothetical protein [Haloquadratum walsbyi]
MTRSVCPGKRAKAPLTELHALDGTLSVIIEWLPSTVHATATTSVRAEELRNRESLFEESSPTGGEDVNSGQV